MKKIMIMALVMVMGVCSAFTKEIAFNDTGLHQFKTSVKNCRDIGFYDKVFIVNESDCNLKTKIILTATYEPKYEEDYINYGTHTMRTNVVDAYGMNNFKGYKSDYVFKELSGMLHDYKMGISFHNFINVKLDFADNNDKVKIEKMYTANDDLFIVVVNN